MPIAVVSSPPVGPGPAGPPPSLRERWIWIAPDGIEFELSRFTNGTEVVKGMSGRGAPSVRIRREVIPGQPGERTRSVQHGIREMTVPLYAYRDTFDELHDTLRTLVRYMNPVAGIGVLRRIDRDNNTSDLNCRCVSGLGINGEGSSGPNAFKPVLVFQADDPYWYGPSLTRGFTGSASTSWFPWLPISLGSSSVIGDAVINSESDVDTYPVWQIVGPGQDASFVNETTEQRFSLEFPTALVDGEIVTIDTRPFYKSVMGPDGSNWRRYLTDRSLWALLPGVNHLSLSLGSTTADSYISVTYRNRTLYP